MHVYRNYSLPGFSKLGYDNIGLMWNLIPDWKTFKRKFCTTTFVYNWMIGCPAKNRENCPKKAFQERNKETQIKIFSIKLLVLIFLI